MVFEILGFSSYRKSETSKNRDGPGDQTQENKKKRISPRGIFKFIMCSLQCVRLVRTRDFFSGEDAYFRIGNHCEKLTLTLTLSF